MKRGAGISFALVGLVAAVYAPIGAHPFVALDDDVYLLGNPHVARGLTWDGVGWAFTHTYAANWHPLTWISHMVDVQLFGLAHPGAHHVMGAGLHALNAVLLFLALSRMSGQWGPSAFVAALFAVHPLRVESVAWASERKDLLGGLAFMAALMAYTAYARRPGSPRMLVVLAAQVAGLLAKPTLVTLPLLLLALDSWPLQRGTIPLRARMGEKLPLFLASLAAGLVTIVAQRAEGAVAGVGAIPLAMRVANAPVALATYLAKTAWPMHLACFYPHPATLAPRPRWPLEVTVSAAALTAIAWLAFRARQRRPYLGMGAAWFAIVLLPMLGLLQVGDQAWADRYAYLSTIGIYVAIAWLARDLGAQRPASRRALVWGAAAAVVALGWMARRQTEVWASTETLFQNAVRVTRDNWFAENALGVEAMDRGRLDEARRHFEQSLNDLAPPLRAGYREAHTNLGLLSIQQGRGEDARRELEQVLAIEPGFAAAHNDLALLGLRQGRVEEARIEAQRAVDLRPDFVDAHFNLALALQAEGRLAEAAGHFDRVVRLSPADAEAHAQLGRLLAALGRGAEARAHLAEAVRLKPDHPWAGRALMELDRGGP